MGGIQQFFENIQKICNYLVLPAQSKGIMRFVTTFCGFEVMSGSLMLKFGRLLKHNRTIIGKISK